MKISLQSRHAQMVGDGAFSHKIDLVRKFLEILNLKGHHNCTIGSKVTVILLNGWFLLMAGVASGRVCACSLRSRLIFIILKVSPLQSNALQIIQ